MVLDRTQDRNKGKRGSDAQGLNPDFTNDLLLSFFGFLFILLA